MRLLDVKDDVLGVAKGGGAGLSSGGIWLKAAQLSIVFVSSLLVFAQPAGAVLLKINPADNPANTIQIEGPLSASVLHTAEGLEITIPGVQITLQCDSPAGDICTVVVGNGSGTTQVAGVDTSTTGGGETSDAVDTDGSPGSGGGSDSDDTATTDTSGGSSNSDDDSDPCAGGAPVFGCGDAYSGGGSSGDEGQDSGGSGTGDNSGSGTNGFDTSNSSEDEEEDPCATKGFSVDPACEANSGDVAADSSTEFPNGSDRRVDNLYRLIDVGSAGNYSSGGTADVVIPQGEIAVIGLTMAAEEYAKNEDGTATQNRVDPLVGSINFGPVGQVKGGALRLWVSEKPDGIRLSEACSYGGYTEASIDISVDGSRTCDLRSGAEYYLNFALCDTDASDYNCSQTGARTASGRGVLVVEAKYR